jgi:hypothetical protein
VVGKILVRALLCLSCLLALGSCGFLLGTVFPEDLTQVSARIDLSGKIPREAANSFALSAVTADGVDYVVLASNLARDGIDVFFMDRQLNVISVYSYDELNEPYVSTEGPQGNLAMVDCNSLIVVGNRWFQPSKDGFTLLTQPSATVGVSPWNLGFAAPSLNRNIDNLSMSSGYSINYSVWAGDWSSRSTPPTAIDVSTDTNKKYNLVGLFSDPALQAAILVLHDESAPYDDYFVLPWTEFSPSLTGPLLNNYSASHFTIIRTEQNVTGYAQSGIIGFSPSGGDQRSGEMVRFDLSGNKTSDSLRVNKLQDVQNAYLISGGCYYSYNRETRVVTKINAWW